ncbi:S-adenosylmethionine-binding protein [Sinorhizobium meliloti]|nr:S-adenosylmethionine-binding protein [Sinorhizobium meliloti]
MSDQLPKLGPKAREIVDAVLREGIYRASKESEIAVCRNLNSRQLLSRDRKDGAVWYPTAKLCELAGVTPPEIGQGGEGGPGAPETGADRLPVPEPDVAASPTADLPPLTRLPHHPLAALFPMLPDDELRRLANDIEANGQQEPVWLLDGKILDGRNREAACHLVGIDAWTKEYEGKDPLGFVLSLNLHRRHLTESQRAMVAARIVDWERGINQSTAGSANLPTREAARRLSISERAIIAAKRVREHGTEALADAIRDGRVSVHAGEAISYLEREAQEEVLRREEKDIIQRAKEIRQKRQEIRHAVRLTHMAHVSEAGSSTAGKVSQKFPVIYADPPWQFGVRSEVTGREKSAENHYPTIPTDAICALFDEIGSPAKADAVLFLWATNPMLPDALRVMAAWGFTYVHHWIWDKEVAGTGYWGRDRHELLLIGRRGDPVSPLPGSQPETVYRERKGRHSAKPDYFAEQIERLYPAMPRLEMFCRSPRPGWTAWGFEAAATGEAAA